MTAAQAELLRARRRVAPEHPDRRGTSTGKTTRPMRCWPDRRHGRPRAGARRHCGLQCAARDHVAAAHAPGVVSMTELVRSSMRLPPGSHGRRRCAAPGAGSHQGVGHRPSGRHRHHPCRLRAGALRAPRTTDPRSGGEPARALIAGSGQCGHPHRGRGLKRRISIARVIGSMAWLPPSGCAGAPSPGCCRSPTFPPRPRPSGELP